MRCAACRAADATAPRRDCVVAGLSLARVRHLFSASEPSAADAAWWARALPHAFGGDLIMAVVDVCAALAVGADGATLTPAPETVLAAVDALNEHGDVVRYASLALRPLDRAWAAATPTELPPLHEERGWLASAASSLAGGAMDLLADALASLGEDRTSPRRRARSPVPQVAACACRAHRCTPAAAYRRRRTCGGGAERDSARSFG